MVIIVFLSYNALVYTPISFTHSLNIIKGFDFFLKFGWL